MKPFVLSVTIIFISLLSKAQPGNDTGNPVTLVQAETRMFDAICNNDSAYLKSILTEDYIAINADGKMESRSSTLKNLSKFKGATYKLSQKTTRQAGNTGIVNGRAKFYFRSLLVADVYYTEIWELQGGKWMYKSWQGTMTGLPFWYPVIVSLVSIILLWLIFMFVFRNRRRKTF